MTKDSAIEFLKNLRGQFEKQKNAVAVEAIDCALDEVGKCPFCDGNKEVQVPEPPAGPYRTQRDITGRKKYFVKCAACKGVGKYLEVKCVSCAKISKVTTDQKHMNHCKLCAERLVRKGVL